MSKIKKRSTKIGIACYLRDQLRLLLDTTMDRKKLELTWDEWAELIMKNIQYIDLKGGY